MGKHTAGRGGQRLVGGLNFVALRLVRRQGQCGLKLAGTSITAV
jgi:hypothetical protein